jgi:hypothetical protein
MSVQPSQPSGNGQPAGGGQPSDSEGRRFSTLIGALAATPADTQETAARPTFTARAAGPAVTTAPERTDTPESGGTSEPDASPAHARPVAPTPPHGESTRALPRPAPAAMDEPLLGDAAMVRARWQRVQAGFVDDPKEAVGDAADLIEQTAQALVGALRQRQRQLRVLWESGPADDTAPAGGEAAGGEAAASGADTEHLRLMMQRYRALFNQLCRP